MSQNGRTCPLAFRPKPAARAIAQTIANSPGRFCRSLTAWTGTPARPSWISNAIVKRARSPNVRQSCAGRGEPAHRGLCVEPFERPRPDHGAIAPLYPAVLVGRASHRPAPLMCLQRNFNACRKPMSRRAFAIEAPFARGRHRDLGFVAAATGALRARHIQIDGASGRAHRSTAARRRRRASRVSSFCLPSAYRRYEVELEEPNTAHNYLILLERAMGIEPTTYSLGSCRSTTELRPHAPDRTAAED